MDILALAALVLSTAWSQLAVPDLQVGDLVEPAVQAAIVMPLVLTALLAFRLGGVTPVWERRLMALFLLAMPTVYLGALALHGGSVSWITTELIGQVAFATLAIAGLRGSGWILVIGLAAHGLAWDPWHHGRTPFMPDWYAIGCSIVDVGWALYAANRVAVWHAVAANEHRSPTPAPAPVSSLAF